MIDRLDTPTYSLVIPVFNEEECLAELVGRLRALMGRLDGATEVVFVDDGSRDRSYELIAAACREDATVPGDPVLPQLRSPDGHHSGAGLRRR